MQTKNIAKKTKKYDFFDNAYNKYDQVISAMRREVNPLLKQKFFVNNIIYIFVCTTLQNATILYFYR